MRYERLFSPANTRLATWMEGPGDHGLALDCFVWRRLVLDEVIREKGGEALQRAVH